MSDLICRKTMRRCDTSGMCSPFGGCQAPQTDQDRKIIILEATVAKQAKMIEHLRGGPTPLYTAVDMANAARDGFMDGAASVVVTLSKGDSLARRMSGPQEDGSNPLISRADAVAAIEAAGGTVQGGTKCKDYGHGGFSCGADDCWLRSEPRP
jgi:hypothetical protein